MKPLACRLGHHRWQHVAGSLKERRVDYFDDAPTPQFVVTERVRCSRCPAEMVRPTIGDTPRG